MKLIYDDLLDEYLDENGNIVKGQPIVKAEQGVSFGKPFEVKEVIENNQDFELEKQQIANVEKAITNFKQQIKVLENTKKQVTSKLLNEMQKRNLWQIKFNDITISRIKATERHSIDTNRLKEEMPDIAKMYEQITPIDESVRIKIGGTENEI